jgi:hypothetical protein
MYDQTWELPDVALLSKGIISDNFLEHGIIDFKQACNYIQNLPYGRNADKTKLHTIFQDQCGTCSTKHAVLAQLADEQQINEIQLICGIFKMNGINTPAVAKILMDHDLDYLPEAHNYLKYKNKIFDFTFPENQKSLEFIPDLMEETIILPHQIATFKIEYHQTFLNTWLEANPLIPYTVEQLWDIREECIKALFTNNQHDI